MLSTAKKLVAALGLTLGLASGAQAGVIQLGFILDESGSIGSSNYTIIKNGLANAINTIVPANGTYEISVVTFATSTQVIVNHILIDSAATRTAVANAVMGDAYNGGSTDMAAAFDTMRSTLLASTNQIDSSYVNFATDGVPNNTTTAISARNNLISLGGVDNISVEGIGSGVNASWLKTNICYPGPCDDTSPYNFPTQGFYIGVANAQAYADAIGYKIQVVTNQVPEPGMISLLGLGLIGLALRKRA